VVSFENIVAFCIISRFNLRFALINQRKTTQPPIFMVSLAGKENIPVLENENRMTTQTTKVEDIKPSSDETNPNGTTTIVPSVKTVPMDPNVRHPLRTPWTLWYEFNLTTGKRPSTTQWGENLKEVFTFATVEDFWRLYNNISPPSQIQFGCSYNLFKKGIEPKWEDAANSKGGRWTVIISKSKTILDRMWLWLMLGAIGQVVEEDSDQICGLVVNVRKGQDKLSIWTKDAEDKDAAMKIGERLKRLLELPQGLGLGYQGHFQKETRKNKYEIN